MEEMDFMHSSRTSWALLWKLEAAHLSRKENNVKPSEKSNILFKISNIKPKKKRRKKRFELYLNERWRSGRKNHNSYLSSQKKSDFSLERS